jgi:flagellar biosynthesis/type III secretory pathway protein FliH
VVRDVPVEPDTLLLRLLDKGERLARAMVELDELPQRSPLRQRLGEVALAWRRKIFDTSGKKPMMSPETQALWDELKNELLSKGRREGRKAGREEGRKEGERALVRKLLTLRFGKLPADAEQRLKRASLAELERWAERVLTAKSLAAVLAD